MHFCWNHLQSYRLLSDLCCFYLRLTLQVSTKSSNRFGFYCLNLFVSTFLCKCIDILHYLSFYLNQFQNHLILWFTIFFCHFYWKYWLACSTYFLFLRGYFSTLKNNLYFNFFSFDSMTMYDYILVIILHWYLDSKWNNCFIRSSECF